MELKEYIETKIQPLVRADGGWLEYTSENGDELTLTAKGECARCICIDRCVKWVAGRIEADLGRTVHIRFGREPFLWRK